MARRAPTARGRSGRPSRRSGSRPAWPRSGCRRPPGCGPDGLVRKPRRSGDTRVPLLGVREVARAGERLLDGTGNLHGLVETDDAGLLPVIRPSRVSFARQISPKPGIERSNDLVWLAGVQWELWPVMALEDQRSGFALPPRVHRSTPSSAFGGSGWQFQGVPAYAGETHRFRNGSDLHTGRMFSVWRENEVRVAG